MIYISNIELLTVGIITASTLMLGFVVFFDNKNSVTNRTFLGFSIFTVLWSATNFLVTQVTNPDLAIVILRVAIFFAVWHSFLFYRLFCVYPAEGQKFSRFYNYGILPLVSITSLLTLSPLIFSGLEVNLDSAQSFDLVVGPLIPVFGLTILFLVSGGLYFLLGKLRNASGQLRTQYKYITIGSFLTFSLLITFNLVFPVFLNQSQFTRFGAVSLFPFIAFTTYALLKHYAHNIRVVSANFLVFIISILVLSQILISETRNELLFSVLIFLLVLIFGIALIQSVLTEVKQREKIEELAKSLEKANSRLTELDRLKSQFVSIASHQLRSPLTAIKGYASLILEGSFGKINESATEAIQKIFDSSKLMAVSVQDFLDVSKIEQGKMNYNFEQFDLEKLLRTVIEEQTHTAKEKGLNLTLKITSEGEFKINADMGKIKQVLYNLIDNSIKYTPDGSVNVLMRHVDGKIRIEIHDTGVGISKETLPKLFEKFVRSRNAHHVNVSGSGLGLFVVKQMVEAHKGKVWATSDGEGQGSVFHIELNAM